ncbi:MAG: hypothetical protein M3040_04660 [Bacteroidota bacterium]|nr:hypothetical protein [Bacteroidota bacterium]
MLQVRFASTGVNSSNTCRLQNECSKGSGSKLKDKINKMGGGSSDLEMPDLKPNSQKTRSFLKGIEYGANMQSQNPNRLLWLEIYQTDK